MQSHDDNAAGTAAPSVAAAVPVVSESPAAALSSPRREKLDRAIDLLAADMADASPGLDRLASRSRRV
jgi:hypothetical protein